MEEKPVQTFVQYKLRYLVLGVLCFALIGNAVIWISLSSSTEKVKRFYNVKVEDLNWLGNVFLIIYAAEAIPFSFVPQFIGIKKCLIFGTFFNAASSLIRLLSYILNSPNSRTGFALVITGNSVGGIAQGFILFIPSLVSARWFGAEERNKSTAIALMSGFVGSALGFLLPLLFFGSADLENFKRRITYFGIFELLLTGVTFFASLFVKESPKTPPSLSEANVRKVDDCNFLIKVKSCLKDGKVLLMSHKFLGFIFIYGVYYGLSTVFYIILNTVIEYALSNEGENTGYLGTVAILLGAALTFASGYIVERWQKFRAYFGSLCMLVCFLTHLILLILVIYQKVNLAVLFVLVIIYGGFAAPFMATGYEILADYSYPIPANVPVSFSLVAGNIIGSCLLYGIGALPPKTSILAFLGISSFLYFVSSGLLLLLKFKNHRAEAENLEIA